jgi:hypothetical protein
MGTSIAGKIYVARNRISRWLLPGGKFKIQNWSRPWNGCQRIKSVQVEEFNLFGV